MSDDQTETPVPKEVGAFQASAAVFTYNNPVESSSELLEIFKGLSPKYCIFQLEEGESGTPHYQGYVHFGKRKRIGGPLRALFKGTVWFQRAKGSPGSNRDYCSKSEGRKEGPFEIGVCPAKGQGNRSDLATFRDAVVGGATKRQLLMEHPNICAKYPRFAHEVRMVFSPTEFKRRRVVLLYGDPGTGKTRYASSDAPEGMLWSTPIGGGMWFDGLDEQTHCLIDDFMGRGSKFSLADLLRLLDGYQLQVQVKGSFTVWHPDVIYITTNYHPRDWYDWDKRLPSWGALKRRFTEVHAFRDGKHSIFTPSELSLSWEVFWAPPEPTPKEY